jgi:hypothetical protein
VNALTTKAAPAFSHNDIRPRASLAAGRKPEYPVAIEKIALEAS